MCNRYVQNGREVRPGQKTTVLMRGPGGEFELPFDEAIFGGPARHENRRYWISREGAEEVLVPGIESFGERSQVTGKQNWATVTPSSALEGLLLPQLPGKDYRLLKVITQAGSPEQVERLGNDRVPRLTGNPEIVLPAASLPIPQLFPQQLELLE